jgi:GrpB-like predicted nucleotidyltransferase (UPF0157 family)
MIVLVPYKPSWPSDFLNIAQELRRALGDLALCIDHIGSTAVPGLAAKDIIDVQITVQTLEPAIERALRAIGYQRVEDNPGDHIPPGTARPDGDWAKWVFRPPPRQRPTHVHVRVDGKPNQRYALLFRDYLRTHPDVAQAYAQIKAALARYHADDKDAYYAVKDPVCDIIMGAAEAWAASTDWQAGPIDW